MQEIRGDLFRPETYRYPNGQFMNKYPDVICITVNGFVKKNGESVMGRGCAKQAAQKWPEIKKLVGNYYTNHPLTSFTWQPPFTNYRLVFFPVKHSSFKCYKNKSNVVRHMRKHFEPGQIVPGWALVANPKIIQAAACNLRTMTDTWGWECVILPRPGCGAGELNWTDVKPILDPILDDRFYSITF